jgi:hypothetical protein
MADRKMKKSGQKNVRQKNEEEQPISSFFCLTFFCPLFFIFLSAWLFIDYFLRLEAPGSP